MFWGKETISEACTGNRLGFNNAETYFWLHRISDTKADVGKGKMKLSDLDSVKNLLQIATDTELYL